MGRDRTAECADGAGRAKRSEGRSDTIVQNPSHLPRTRETAETAGRKPLQTDLPDRIRLAQGAETVNLFSNEIDDHFRLFAGQCRPSIGLHPYFQVHPVRRRIDDDLVSLRQIRKLRQHPPHFRGSETASVQSDEIVRPAFEMKLRRRRTASARRRFNRASITSAFLVL